MENSMKERDGGAETHVVVAPPCVFSTVAEPVLASMEAFSFVSQVKLSLICMQVVVVIKG